MPLSWNEIKTRALAFSKEWQKESSEDAEEVSPDGTWQHASIIFKPDTTASGYKPIKLSEEQGNDLKVIAELVAVLGWPKAVDVAYGKTNFQTEAQRVAFLFELYQKYTSLFAPEKPKRRVKSRDWSPINPQNNGAFGDNLITWRSREVTRRAMRNQYEGNSWTDYRHHLRDRNGHKKNQAYFDPGVRLNIF